MSRASAGRRSGCKLASGSFNIIRCGARGVRSAAAHKRYRRVPSDNYAEAPARQPQIGTYTPLLADDGHDLAAAIQTIKEIGDAPALAHAVEDAFPSSTLEISSSDGRMSVQL